MAKAYDRVSWLHLIGVLRKFGFGERFIDMVWRLISNVWFSVMINGTAHGFFKSCRGLRQGDPLSPALFVIGAEVLSRGLNNLAAQSSFLGFTVPQGCPGVTHLAFADDVLILANGSATTLRRVMRVLQAYQRSSGQMLNAHKSGYLVHPSLSVARRRVIERIKGFSRQVFPTRYLGFPLYIGRFSDRVVSLDYLHARKVLSGNSSLPSGVQAISFSDLEADAGCQPTGRTLHVVAGSGWVVSFLGRWNAQLLSQVLPRDIIAVVLSKSIPNEQSADEVVWMPATSGKFSLASAYQELPNVDVVLIQRPSLLNMSFRRDRLPRQSGGFLRGCVASQVQLLTSGPASPLGGWPRLARSDGRLFFILCRVSSVGIFERRGTVQFLKVFSRNPAPFVRLSFRRPRFCLKFSLRNGLRPSHSCSYGNGHPSHEGAFFGQTSSLHAEALALLTGLRICGQKGVTDVSIQLDSQVLVGILQHRLQCSWHVRGEVRQIWSLVRDPSRFSHCFREANKVADALANVGVAHPHQDVQLYEHWSDWPRLARGGVSLDSMGVPSFRMVRNS
ncbi:uncharacterized protein [Coffea arabica]|uniref:Reverse transcriptase domain-containing protein n=1 Tax=Coffea arabica TaxID=13443 RepID=A0ABM4URC1_COFAR